MKGRTRIFQPIVPAYRVALFDGLAQRYGAGIEVEAADSLFGDVSVPLKFMRFDYSHSFIRIGPFLWQKGLSLDGLSRGDVVVVCGDLHQLSSLWIAFRARIRGMKVVWWGHHVSAQARAFRVKIRLLITKFLADVVLCYTDVGVSFFEAAGFRQGRVFATGNTIDLGAVSEATCGWTESRLDAFRSEHGLLDGKVLLFCGVLREKVRLDVLLSAFKTVLGEFASVKLVVVGGGEMLFTWRRLAEDLGVGDHVIWVGELREQEKLAPWFLSADLFTYPGRIGLSLIHAFSFGLPVILNNNPANHGPEYVAFRNGVNGVAFKEGDAGDLAEKIKSALKNPDLRCLGMRGRDFVFENYSMEKMVANFAEAIDTAFEL